MRTVEIIGYKRANLGKSESKRIRAEGNVPCVLYGGKDHVHFYAPAIQFRPIFYTPEACFVHLNIEGDEYQAIVQDSQFHPVSEIILHVDFLQLFENKPVKMSIPVKPIGNAPGVQGGGKLIVKMPKLQVKALPNNMPDTIEIDVSELNLGKSIKVSAVTIDNFEILNSPLVTIASVNIPRLLKGKSDEELEMEETDETTTEEESTE